MSPEQAKGRPATNGADIWAFGCVLYEMLTGQARVRGRRCIDTLAAILRAEPDWSVLPLQTPAAIRRLLRRCLEKDRKDRLRDIGDAFCRHQGGAHRTLGEAAAVTASPCRFWHWRRIAPVAVGRVRRCNVRRRGVWLTMRPAPPRVTRTEIASPRAEAVSDRSVRRNVAITPDGTRVVYVGSNARCSSCARWIDWRQRRSSGLGAPTPALPLA